MSRANDLDFFHVRLDMTDQTVDTHIVNFTCPRPIYVHSVKAVPGLPMDTDGDTIAVDVSYSTDGFSSSDVEIAALSAIEFNDTTAWETLYTSVDIPLNTSNDDVNGRTRVPADAVVRVTVTSTGASADGFVDVFVWYNIL